MNKEIVKDFLTPLLLLAVVTALIAASGADLGLESRFYVPGSGWIYADREPWYALYHFGVYPAFAIGGASLAVIVAGFFSPRASLYRRCATFFLLLLLLGPGLLVNGVFKDHWGRPRPRQMQIFGGDRTFHQVWERGEGGKGKSFPSGHASAAFYLIAPYFVLRNSSRRRARLALALGSGYGLFMGVARMAQGGHFPSDVLWAGGCVYLVGLMLYYLLRLDRGVLPQPGPQPVPLATPITSER